MNERLVVVGEVRRGDRISFFCCLFVRLGTGDRNGGFGLGILWAGCCWRYYRRRCGMSRMDVSFSFPSLSLPRFWLLWLVCCKVQSCNRFVGDCLSKKKTKDSAPSREGVEEERQKSKVGAAGRDGWGKGFPVQDWSWKCFK